jgi:hypothetical protein
MSPFKHRNSKRRILADNSSGGSAHLDTHAYACKNIRFVEFTGTIAYTIVQSYRVGFQLKKLRFY